MTPAAILFSLVLLAAVAAVLALYRPDLSPARLERELATPPSAFAAIDGVRLHLRDEGVGPPVVLLHGLTSNLFVWDAWVGLLRRDCRLLRLDLPGHGLTGPDPRARYDWPAMARLVVRLMDERGIGRAAIIGNSLGGAVAWHLAAAHPRRVAQLVLIAPVGYPMAGRPPPALRLLRRPALGWLLLRFTYRRAFADQARRTVADPARLDEAAINRDYRLFRRRGNRDALLAALGGGGDMPDPRPLLRQITAPTLVLWGAADPVLPPAMSERFAADIPGAERRLVERAGHAPMAEQPEASAALLRRFLGLGGG